MNRRNRWWLLGAVLPLLGCPPEILPSDENTAATCADGIDNDVDGSADCADFECIDFPNCVFIEVCSGGQDEDDDGLIDCDDPECANASNCSESSCNDGADNDTDGDIDCADSDCVGNPACVEVSCNNNADDDLDGDTDCDDSDCVINAACIESICNDLTDNDFDGAIDCGDSDCANNAACQSVCGDSILEAQEQCDDGNTSAGDGCSGVCQIEPGFEVEFNNNSVIANDFNTVSIAGVVNGRVNPALDKDLFRVNVPAGASANITAQTIDSFSGVLCSSNDIDSEITIFNAALVSQANDDDGGDGFCSLAAANNVPSGDYFIEVIATGGSTATFDYTLQVTIDLIICGDNSLDVGEQCDDGNTTNDDGCSAACLIENVGFDCPSGQSLVQISANNVNLAIPDNNVAGVTNAINVSNAGIVRRAMVRLDSITHTFDGDLEIFLRSPGNVEEVELSTDNGSLDNNYTNTLFDDNCGIAGNGLITAGTAPFTGCFAPETALSDFNGLSASGNWTLFLRDDATSDTGVLQAWTLGLCVQ